ncbi:alpha/beta fold hydrolase [Symbioplanes lichenis]|uniref:alpha/beta fold hydrolase n=1 Tax=Symbioplanes lichenis TaxID=1629072 RepID=UPI0027395AB4|nr:alpha/beta hydrolase [Actinoplanes lichenis]
MLEQSELTLADGVTLSVEASGPRRAPVTVVFLHGWCLDRHIWRHQTAALADSDTRIVSYDARGHGRSGTTRLHSATVRQLGEDLAEVIDTYAPRGPVVLAGHSLGGMTIMEYANLYPGVFAERVAGLLFVSTTAEGATHTCYGLPRQLTPALRLAEQTGAGVLARLGAWRPHRYAKPALQPAVRWLLFGDDYDRGDLETTMAAVNRATLRSIGGFRASVGAQHRLDTLAALGDVPAAALVGDRDRLTPPACAESIADALVGTELTVCEGAGHMLMMERPDVVTGALTGVLGKAVSRGKRESYGKAA